MTVSSLFEPKFVKFPNPHHREIRDGTVSNSGAGQVLRRRLRLLPRPRLRRVRRHRPRPRLLRRRWVAGAARGRQAAAAVPRRAGTG